MRGMSRAFLVAIAIGALADAAGCGSAGSSNDAAGGSGGGAGSGAGGGSGWRRRLFPPGRGSGRDLSRGAAGRGRNLQRHAEVLLRGSRRQRPHGRELCERRVERRDRSVHGRGLPVANLSARRDLRDTRRRRAAGRVRAERVRRRRGVVRLPAVVLRHLHGWRFAGVQRFAHPVQHVSVRPVPVTRGDS